MNITSRLLDRHDHLADQVARDLDQVPVADVERALTLPPVDVAPALLALIEDQWFDRKSVRISPKKLAEALVAMANADGGWIVIGLSEGQVEDIHADPHRLNEILQAAAVHTDPKVRLTPRFVDVLDPETEAARQLLVFSIGPSDLVHCISGGKSFLRIGDEAHHLRPDEIVELGYDKGATRFETSEVTTLGPFREELDLDLLRNYNERIGGSDILRTLEDRTLTTPTAVTVVGCLLFFRNPQKYFPNAQIRVSRWRGTSRETGRSQNLIADERIEGPIPHAISAARTAITDLQPKRRALTDAGIFSDVPTVPADAWLEGLVNAVIHRSYSSEGDHIHVDVYDDRIEIFSPGRFPHIVDVSDPLTIRRYARNPRIVRVCYDLKICQELGEGIKRMFDEMRLAGLQQPLYRQDMTGVTLTLSAAPMNEELDRRFPQGIREILAALREKKQMSTAELVDVVGMGRPAVRRRLNELRDLGVIGWNGKAAKDPRAYWYLRDDPKAGDESEA